MTTDRTPSRLGEAMRRREAALRRFAQLERQLDCRADPATAIAGIGWLYELLPESSRHREIDVSGVKALHRALSVLESSTTR